jgi:NDP-4-keto-2,6-dideoxyhexose 3-C-methyltransferase
MNKKIIECRLCSSAELTPVVSFGNQYLTNFVDKKDTKLPRCPLKLVYCENCGLTQLTHTFERDDIYRNYWYYSGINETMRKELEGITLKAKSLVKLEDDDIVLDIGSNDGTLLNNYMLDNVIRVGFEPAKNLSEYSSDGKTIINDYFTYELFNEKFPEAKAKIITAIAMFYDLSDPNRFVEDMEKCLDDDGVGIIQLNYTPLMFKRNAFDNVMHEHLTYYNLGTLGLLFEKHYLDIFDAELNEVNGGSIRIYICKQGKRPISSNVETILKQERLDEMNTIKPLKKFASDTKKLIRQVNHFIDKEVKDGKTIMVYGASSRGNVFLQACKLDKSKIPYAIERNPVKYGKLMVGSWIPIISEEDGRAKQPDYFLVLPWQFRDEFIVREEKFCKKGGKLIFVFPEFSIAEWKILEQHTTIIKK